MFYTLYLCTINLLHSHYYIHSQIFLAMALALLLFLVQEEFQLMEPFRFSVLGLTRNWLETRLRKGKVKPKLYFSFVPRNAVKSNPINNYWCSSDLARQVLLSFD